MLEVRPCKYGRGVFATRDIKSGELIHVAPVIVLTKDEYEIVAEHTILSNYVFNWHKRHKNCALALGYGSLFNHSYNPNALYKLQLKKQTIDFYAYTDIKAGEEILINYNGDPDNNEPLWFEVL